MNKTQRVILCLGAVMSVGFAAPLELICNLGFIHGTLCRAASDE